MPEETEGQGPEETTRTEEESTKAFSAEYVGELRGEAASWRRKYRDLEKRVEVLDGELKAHEDSKKTEMERLIEEKAKLERELIDRDRAIAEAAISTEVRLAATAAGCHDPDAVHALIDHTAIEYDDGKVKGVKKALDKLISEKPYLVTPQGPPSPGAGGPPVQGAKTLDEAFLDLLKK